MEELSKKDFTALLGEGRDKWFCDNRSKPIVIYSAELFRDVIYERPLSFHHWATYETTKKNFFVVNWSEEPFQMT